MKRANKTGRINFQNSLNPLRKERKNYWTRTFRSNCSRSVETRGHCAPRRPAPPTVLAGSPQQIQELNRHRTKLWGGWVGPIPERKIVFPKLSMDTVSSRLSRDKAASVPTGRAPLLRRSQMNAWLLPGHYRAPFHFNLFKILTFRIICFKKREEGMKRKHVYCLSV